MAIRFGDERVLRREVMIDQPDGYFSLCTDPADGQSVVAILLETFNRRFDQRLPPLVRQLALEARFRGFFAGALQSGRSIEPPPFEIDQDLARRVVSRGAGDAAARVCAGTTHVESRQRAPVIPVAQSRPSAEHLI